jgi:transcriptional regulator with XRE-family HTH domain
MTASGVPMTSKTRLARNLRIARVAKGLNQMLAAEQLGVSRQTLNAWEREDEAAPKPDETTLDRIARVYGVQVATLRYGSVVTETATGGVVEIEPALPDDDSRSRIALSKPLLARAKRAEADVIELGADDDEQSWFRAQLYSEETAKLFQMGRVARHRSEAELLKHFESFITALKANIRQQIEWRQRETKTR